MIGRINNPERLSEKKVLSAQGAWGLPTIQFSKRGQTKGLLKSVNALCKIFGGNLPVRFYGHYQDGFDAAILKDLPDVKWLLLDCLQNIENPEHIFQLRKLKKLSFGVYNFENPDFLSELKLQNLEQLAVGETKKRNIDLAPLVNAENIRSLAVGGHTKNIDEIGKLKHLETLSLHSIGKNVSCEFVSGISSLKALKFILGGRQNIDEISHPFLSELEIIRVRGFNDLGDLSRFPSLGRLQIEDQIKLLSLSLKTPELTELKILNCKSLNQLNDLDHLSKINHLRCYETSLDYEDLCRYDWPESLEVLALYSGRKKQDAALRQQLDAKGYKEFS